MSDLKNIIEKSKTNSEFELLKQVRTLKQICEDIETGDDACIYRVPLKHALANMIDLIARYKEARDFLMEVAE